MGMEVKLFQYFGLLMLRNYIVWTNLHASFCIKYGMRIGEPLSFEIPLSYGLITLQFSFKSLSPGVDECSIKLMPSHGAKAY